MESLEKIFSCAEIRKAQFELLLPLFLWPWQMLPCWPTSIQHEAERSLSFLTQHIEQVTPLLHSSPFLIKSTHTFIFKYLYLSGFSTCPHTTSLLGQLKSFSNHHWSFSSAVIHTSEKLPVNICKSLCPSNTLKLSFERMSANIRSSWCATLTNVLSFLTSTPCCHPLSVLHLDCITDWKHCRTGTIYDPCLCGA